MVDTAVGIVNVTLPNGSQLTWDYLAKTATIQGRNPGAQPDIYGVQETPCSHGRSFIFTKEGGAFYRVIVADGQRSLDHECTCRGFLVHGHCKHADAAVAIAERTVSMVPVEPAKSVLTDWDRAQEAAYWW